MPSTWKRATVAVACGAEEGCEIPAGAPYCVLSGPGWAKLRCQRHCSIPVPADLDQALAAQTQPIGPSSFTGLRQVAQALPVDFAKRAANDEE